MNIQIGNSKFGSGCLNFDCQFMFGILNYFLQVTRCRYTTLRSDADRKIAEG